MAFTLAAGAQAQSRTIGSDQGAVLRFFPNPATTQVTFDFSRSFDRGFTLQVYNFLGRKMYEGINVAQRTTLNLTDYNRGVYIFQLLDRAGKMVETGKFQVSK
jgi:hypothetical protein